MKKILLTTIIILVVTTQAHVIDDPLYLGQPTHISYTVEPDGYIVDIIELDRNVELNGSMGVSLSVDNYTGGEMALVGVWNASRQLSPHLLEEVRKELTVEGYTGDYLNTSVPLEEPPFDLIVVIKDVGPWVIMDYSDYFREKWYNYPNNPLGEPYTFKLAVMNLGNTTGHYTLHFQIVKETMPLATADDPEVRSTPLWGYAWLALLPVVYLKRRRVSEK